MRVQLTAIDIPDAVRFLACDADHPPPYVLAVPGSRLRKGDDLWTETVFASSVVVECQVPPGTDTDLISFTVTAVSHLYDLPGLAGGTKAGDCHNDVACYTDWDREAAGVARIMFIDNGNTYLCTGCLLQANDPAQLADYFLTAYHCIGSQDVASTLECFWFYRTGSCGGPPPNLADVPRTRLGADFLAGSPTSDFAFLRLREAAPTGGYRVAWTAASPSAGQVTTIHYPRGSYERISFGNLPGGDTDFWRVKWFSGVTEEGSSGAPLFNSAHQLIGQLYGGYSSCANPSGSDLYGRFDKTYAAVRPWLDPAGAPGSPASAPPLRIVAGLYSGLILSSGTTTPETTGALTVKITTRNRFSASLHVGSLLLSRSGSLDSGGRARLDFKQGSVSVTLQAHSNPDRITGAVTTPVGNASLEASRIIFEGNAANAGRYTAVFAGGQGSKTLPNGNSYLAFRAGRTGNVIFEGKLANGDAVAGSAWLSMGGRLPFFVRGRPGEVVAGWLQMAEAVSSVSGDVVWMTKADGLANQGRPAFSMASSLSGCRYTVPLPGESPLPSSQARLMLAGSGLVPSVETPIFFKSSHWESGSGTNLLQIFFYRKTGLFRGQLQENGKTLRMQGAVLQAQGIGSGFFLGIDNGGTVLIDPSGAQP